jgi:hypothetical protein
VLQSDQAVIDLAVSKLRQIKEGTQTYDEAPFTEASLMG